MMWAPAAKPGGRRILSRWLAGLIGALLLVEPVGAQDATTIAQAQEALEAARSMRVVRALAAPELDAAEQALERALAAREAGRARSEIEHLAYLAEQRAAIARMQAEERKAARALESLSAAHALIAEARALEAAAAERRARALAQRLARFDVRADKHGLLLMPRERWFEADLMPARSAVRAMAEAARLLGKLPERKVVVLGYAMRGVPAFGPVPNPGAETGTTRQLPAHYQAAGATSQTVIDRDDLGCVRAEVVRAFLISNGVDPRRIAARCIAPEGTPETSAPAADEPPAGQTAIAILPQDGSARAPIAGAASAPAPTTR